MFHLQPGINFSSLSYSTVLLFVLIWAVCFSKVCCILCIKVSGPSSCGISASQKIKWWWNFQSKIMSLWILFPHVFVSKWLMEATIFEIGPVLSESAAAGSHETGCNVSPAGMCSRSAAKNRLFSGHPLTGSDCYSKYLTTSWKEALRRQRKLIFFVNRCNTPTPATGLNRNGFGSEFDEKC